MDNYNPEELNVKIELEANLISTDAVVPDKLVNITIKDEIAKVIEPNIEINSSNLGEDSVFQAAKFFRQIENISYLDSSNITFSKYIEESLNNDDYITLDISKVLSDTSITSDSISYIVDFKRLFEDTFKYSEVLSFSNSKVLSETKAVSEVRKAYKQNYFSSDYVEPSYAGEAYSI